MNNIKIKILLTLILLTFSPFAKAVVITVDSITDAISDDGHCTLREAIRAANNNIASSDTTGTPCPAGSSSETDEIRFDASTNNTPFCFIRTGSSEEAASTGDLDITQSLTITGNGVSQTIIDGGHRPSVDDPVSTCSNELGDRIFDIRSTATTVTINGVTVEGGYITSNGQDGAGIASSATNLNLESSIIQYNTIASSSGSRCGAGILSGNASVLNLTNTRVTHNLLNATGNSILIGAGICTYNHTITNSEISFNRIDGTGNGYAAGIEITNTSVKSTITNSTIANNTISVTLDSVAGGILLENSAVVDIVSSTIANNTASVGGGIKLYADGETLNLLNTIIADNTATTGSDCDNSSNGTITSAGYNIIENNCGITLTTGDLTGDPGLLELADNGGPTYTTAFSADSIALDAGTCTNTLNSEDISLDQRGVTRSGNCDIGAFERISFFPDADSDGYGGPASIYFYDNGLAEQTDCNDNDSAINPAAAETCNLVDNNCSGNENDASDALTFYTDSDGDGFGDLNAPQTLCAIEAGYVENSTDCDDANAHANSASDAEICDGFDNNCADGADEGLSTASYYPDADGDDFGDDSATAVVACSAAVSGLTNATTDNTDCDDTDATLTTDCSTSAVPVCGDGHVDTGEECDDSGASATCSAECKTITPTKTKKKSSGGGCSLTAGPVLRSLGEAGAPTGGVIFFLLFVPMMVRVGVFYYNLNQDQRIS